MADGTPDTSLRPTRPKLTFPVEVAELVREVYSEANVILEYGSGGSTVMASELEGKTVFSVESDGTWLANLEALFAQEGTKSTVHMHRGNIGKTGKWGKPNDDKAWRRYHLYPLSVWDREDFKAPDVVLIDGRCRAACMATVLLRTKRDVTVLFDDYLERDLYKRVERWIKPKEYCGRMARFEVSPMDFPRDDMTELFTLFTKTF